MKQMMTTLVIVLVMHLSEGALAQRAGSVEGVFIKLAERTVDDRVCTAVLVKPFDRDSYLEVLVPNEAQDLAQIARRLRPGHQVKIEFVLDGGQRWLQGIEAQWHASDQDPRSEERIVVRTRRREDAGPPGQENGRIRMRVEEHEGGAVELRPTRDRPQDSERTLAQQFEQLGQQFRHLVAQVARMERDIQTLRAENERLRRLLGERRVRSMDLDRRDTDRPERPRGPATEPGRVEKPERRIVRQPTLRDRDRPALPHLPDSLTGFKGVLTGKLVRKLDRGLVLKLEHVTRVWKQNQAENPQVALGKTLVVLVKPEQESTGQFLRTLRGLKVGQEVLVEAFHLGGEYLTVVEQLRALD